jgi:acyl-CoA hydrolase
VDGADQVLAEFKPGLSVYIQGAVTEPLALRSILAEAPQVLAGVNLTSCLLPGINDFDYAGLNDTARLSVFMLPAALRASFEAGRVCVTPLAYSNIAAHLRYGPAPDVAIFQVAPPDERGECAFGPTTDFMPLIWRRAGRRVAFINPSLPVPRSGPTLPRSALDVAIEADGPFITAVEPQPTADQLAIARRVAELVPDGAALQTGIGGAPAAMLALLKNHSGLVIRSGMVTEGYRTLAEEGALAVGGHVTGLALGSLGFVKFACEHFAFADASVTHGAEALASVERLTSINSALEIDLFGQANIEWQGGRLISGVGGAPDFTRAAKRSRGGRAIIALPSTAKGGEVSRIVARLSSPTASIPRDEIDTVVTEHGAAHLRALSMDERAAALIAIAAPEHRERLNREWAQVRRGL